MARINTTLKLNGMRGPRIPYDPAKAEVEDNEYASVTADGIMVPDGEGILYWVETLVLSDAGGLTLYDEQSATGVKLTGAYAAKAVSSVINSYDPPKKYYHGIFANLTTAEINICYRPYARNLRCRVSPVPEAAKNLVCRVTTDRTSVWVTKDLKMRVISKVRVGTDLVSRVTCTRTGILIRKDLVSRVTTLRQSFSDLVMQLKVSWIQPDLEKVLDCQVTVLKEGTLSLVSRTETLKEASSNLTMQVTGAH